MSRENTPKEPLKLGPARPRKGETGMVFFPDFALREAIAAIIFFAILLLIAILTKPPLEEVANPQASGYVPRPEWYFLWLFQMLKYFKGNLEPIGTVLIPAVGVGALILLPFLDKRPPKPRILVPGARPVRLWPRVAGTAVLGIILGITWLAISSSHPMTPEGTKLTVAQASGQATFEQMGCLTCHKIGESGGTRAPDLTHFASQPGAEDKVLLHFSGIGQEAGSMMPVYQLTSLQVENLAAYLMSRK